MNIYTYPVVIIDIGAAQPDHSRWEKFSQRTIVCFEPNKDEFDKLIPSRNTRYYNLAVAEDDGKIPLHVTGFWSNTSTLCPNMALIDTLAYERFHWEIVKTLNIDCATLDSALATDGITPDFIKIDTQGSELAILQTSPVSVGSAFGAEVEVEFLPLYENQPLFEDVQRFMRMEGFQLMDLGNRLHVKGKNSIGIGGEKSNFISADALYFRCLDTIELWAKNADRLNAAIAVCLAYGYEDYALELCLKIQKSTPELRAHATCMIDFLTKASVPARKSPP